MKKFFVLRHGHQQYRVSLDPIENRNKEPEAAFRQIDTNKVLLPSGRRVSEYKADFERYRTQGGTLKIKAYLDVRAEEDFGKSWDSVIAETKASMVSMFGSNKVWDSPADQIRLRYLAESGHALAAYIIGEALMKKGDDLAIEWLCQSHNAGHTFALLLLSGYLVKKRNPLGAIACKVISADSGCSISQLAICHPENIDYMLQCAPDQLSEVLADMSEKTIYSMARYLQAILLMATGEEQGFDVLDKVIANPLKRPKKGDIDKSFIERECVIREFCTEVRERVLCLKGSDWLGSKTLVVFRNTSERYHFISDRDFVAFDEHFQRVHRTHALASS